MTVPEVVPADTICGLVPASMAEAMQLAEMMASAKLVPVGLQKSPADCLMVIQQAVRWQMDPFAVAQECSVIQGKLMHSGKLVAAVVNARGNLTQRLAFDYRGTGDDRVIVVSGQLQGEPAPRTVEVAFKNARTTNRVWQTQPDQQLMYHGVRVWARRHTPELMLGVYSPEEFDEAFARRPVARPNAMLDAYDSTPDAAIDPDLRPPQIPAPPAPETDQERIARLDGALAAAAEQGWKAFKTAWESIGDADAAVLNAAMNKRHKPRAVAVERARKERSDT